MYNEQQKQRFLATINPAQYPPGYWGRLFEQYGIIEEELQKDLCNFTKPEICKAHKFMSCTSYETLLVNNINMKAYTTWALQNSLVNDGINHYDDMTPEDIFACVNQGLLQSSIVSRDLVLNRIRSLDNPRSAFIVLGIFEGIRGTKFSDLVSLKLSDFDKSACTVTLPSGSTRPVSSDLIYWAEMADQQNILVTVNGREFQLYGTRIIKRLRSTNIKEDDTEEHRNVYREALRSFDMMGFTGKVSTNSLYTSGMIDMINQIARRENVTAQTVLYVKPLFAELNTMYSMQAYMRSRFLMKYKEFLVGLE